MDGLFLKSFITKISCKSLGFLYNRAQKWLFTAFVTLIVSPSVWALEASVANQIRLSQAHSLLSQHQVQAPVVLGIFDISFYGHKVLLPQHLSENFESPVSNLVSPHGVSVAQLITHPQLGVNPQARIAHVNLGIFYPDIVRGVEAMLHKNIRLVNASLFFKESRMIDVLNGFIRRGGIVIASAGNEAIRQQHRGLPDHYRSFEGLIVGAVDENGVICDFSQYLEGKTILVPGGKESLKVLRLVHSGFNTRFEPTFDDFKDQKVSVQAYGFGMTSGATAIVTGVVSMALQIKPDLSMAQIQDLIFSTASLNPQGYKVLNAEAFLQAVIGNSL